MQTVSKFQELSKTFINLKNKRNINIFYGTKIITVQDSVNYSEFNFINIGKNKKTLNMMYGGVNPMLRVKDSTAFSNIDYVNLMNVFKEDTVFLEKAINTIEKELLI